LSSFIRLGLQSGGFSWGFLDQQGVLDFPNQGLIGIITVTMSTTGKDIRGLASTIAPIIDHPAATPKPTQKEEIGR